MVIRGGPAPNKYALPPTLGPSRHDPTKLKYPVYTIRRRHGEERVGLGPGLYNLAEKTRNGPARAPAYTMRAKLNEISDHYSPAPTHYHPEKYLQQKHNPPKFTMARRTEPVKGEYVPAPNRYTLPPTLGPCASTRAITMGCKINTPRGQGNPAPNRYRSVDPDKYKPASAKFTMRRKTALAEDKTQRPAPNTYYPKPKDKFISPFFSFMQRDVDRRIVVFTEDDIQKH